MTLSGNSDPDDRMGYLLGKIPGTMHVHVEIGGFGSGSDVNGCSHIFAGPRLGCTTMLVVDLGALRKMKRKRGFITTGGSALKACSHSHSKLRGFCSLSMADFLSHADRGYTARYRVVCGIGFNAYNIWDVTIHTTLAAGAGTQDGAPEMVYSSDWSVVAAGSAGGPLVFARVVTASPTLVLSSLRTENTAIQLPSSSSSSSVISADVAPDLRLVSDSASVYEVIFRSRENLLRVQRLVSRLVQPILMCSTDLLFQYFSAGPACPRETPIS